MNSTIDDIMAKKLYEDIKKYEGNLKVAKNMITHIDTMHLKHYVDTVQETLGVEKEGVEDISQKDLEKLKEEEHNKKFREAYMDKVIDSSLQVYAKTKDEEKLKRLKEELNLSDEFNEALLTRSVFDNTRSDFYQTVAREKDNFTSDTFVQKYKKAFMERVRQDLIGAAGQHLTKEHINPILEYAVEKDYIDKIKDYINLESAKAILNSFKGKKFGAGDLVGLNKDMINQSGGRMYLLPPTVAEDLEKEEEKEKKKTLSELAEEAEEEKGAVKEKTVKEEEKEAAVKEDKKKKAA